jgi:phosphoribosylformylglycinamidine cyclo-ligase
MGLTYKSAGLDLELYEQAMARLPALMKRTHTPRVQDLPGGFAGLFRLGNSPKFARNYSDPVLVSGTDGVGTKLKVAILAKKYDTVGIDLVAMSVNDCLCLGAEPLFFLDYIALAKDDPDLITTLVKGVTDGCVESGAALLGGETAIMPDMYQAGDFDMAGFCVAVAERKQLIDGQKIKPKDVVIGLASSGLHSNGYSLARKIAFEKGKLTFSSRVPALGKTVGDELLTPTRIYVKPILAALEQHRAAITGLAHITGGGLIDNTIRILPPTCQLAIDRAAWEPLPVFQWLQKLGKVDTEEMFQVFNMGIGFVLIVRPRSANKLLETLNAHALGAKIIGEIRPAN